MMHGFEFGHLWRTLEKWIAPWSELPTKGFNREQGPIPGDCVASCRAHDLAQSVLCWPGPTRIILVAPGAPGPPRQLTEFGGSTVPELAKTGRDLMGLPGDGQQ